MLENENENPIVSADQAMEATMRETMKGIQAREAGSDVQTASEGNEQPAQAPTEPLEKQAGETERTRDATGKFKPKVDKAADAPVEGEKSLEGQGTVEGEVKQPQGQPQASVTQAPSSWSPEAKAEWDKLPPVIKAQALKREQDISRAVQQSADRVKRAESIEKIIEPHKGLLSRSYASTEAGITDLLNTFQASIDNPLGFAAWFLQSRGINPQQLSGVMQQSAQAQPQDPNVAALLNRVTGLEGQITQRQQEEKQQLESQATQMFQAFAADPKNSYVNDVMPDMAELLDKGLAENLQDAYDKAIYMRPDLREKIWQERSDAQKKAEQVAREAQAKDARKSAVVAAVTRPNAGATPSQPKSWEDTLREKHNSIQRGVA